MSILNKIRSNNLGFNIGRAVLSNRFIVNNKAYQKAYEKKIKKVIKNLENKAPTGLDIGTTNACNSNCVMCPHHLLKEIGFMDMNLYKKIIDNCASFGIKNITLSFFGEPLLDQTIIEKIEYAKSEGLIVGFYSNASLLKPDISKRLIGSGLDAMTISFDAYSKEIYEKIRVGLKFDETSENLTNFMKMRKELGLKKPLVSLVLVELDENRKEIKKFYSKWKKVVDSINIINQRNWAGNLDKDSKKSFHFKAQKRWPCSFIWQKLIVDWNGDVLLCCDDWNHREVLGNLKNQKIEDIWFGDRLKQIRTYHLNGEFDKIPLCQGCNKKTIWWLLN
jgi:radical SAM protein with 4Fe4S-binding SPASM domain